MSTAQLRSKDQIKRITYPEVINKIRGNIIQITDNQLIVIVTNTRSKRL